MEARQAAGAAGHDQWPDGDPIAGELEGKVPDVVRDESCGTPRLDEAGGDQDDDALGGRRGCI
ncbi:hypothetical protein ABC195_14620 [Microbacterium sp. 2P01SA-2]|uniref:hypothetical protein n=1 Tax=Microbacterium sp. 2P01SA-2 TaxID=3132290 RepID=UPI0039A07475